MSASPVFSSAAMGRPFIFAPPYSSRANTEKTAQEEAARKTAVILFSLGAIRKLAAAVVPASRLEVRPAPEMVSSGIPQLDSLTGGFPRGCLTEICGAASSGRTSVLLVALARATRRGEVCALVDASDAYDPASAVAAGMETSRLLWVRCGERGSEKTGNSYPGIHPDGSYRGMPSGRPQVREGDFSRAVHHWPSSSALAAEGHRRLRQEQFPRGKYPESKHWESQLTQMLKVTDLLLQSNGFGMIALDLGDVPVQSARRIPLASWFRFRRAVEHTPTVLLVLEQQPIAGSCSSVLLKISGARSQVSGHREKNSAQSELAHAELLDQLDITAELLRSRFERTPERRPVQSTAIFKSRAAWAG